MSIHWTQLLVAIAALAGGGGAAALGFGPVRSAVTLGQPLSLAVPVNLGEGESLSAECVGAEVTAGDSRLPPSAVRVRVTQGRDASESVLRITTTSVIDEPVLSVLVSAGCPPRLTRNLVLLADPPLATTVTAAAEPPSPRGMAAAPSPAAAAAAQPTPAAAATAVAPPLRARRPATPPRATRMAQPSAARAVPAAVSVPAAAPARVAAAAVVRPTPAEPKSRLRLEAGQVSANQAAVLAAQEQASAARATASAAEASAVAAAERVRAMESEVTRLRADAKAQTDALLQLRQQLALDRAERDKFSPLMAVLVAVLAVLAAMAAWLAWRLRQRVEAPVNPDWWDRGPASVAPADVRVSQATKPAAFGTPPQPEQRIPSAPVPWSDQPATTPGSVDALIAPPTTPAPTQVTGPALTLREEEASRAVSVDEQIDLEQQADFFIALGHDDAAIDLLMAHLRSTGGGIPLPYLKLLEIHRRRGQRDAYERTRVRFNQRFNSVAPDWDTDPKTGRSLEDYPLVIGRVQRAWPSPLDVMAELEALLFRRGSDAELFDLPAYQELLFLYLLARDLHQQGGGDDTQDVDVLLPIGGRSAPIAAAEGTIVLRPEFNHGQALSLDLDLSADHDPSRSAAGTPAPTAAPQASDLQPLEPDEGFWGGNPDTRPTR